MRGSWSSPLVSSRRLRVEIRGAVQGVGFRPFVYRLATELGLAGWVLNDVRGVEVEVEGTPALLEAFRTRLEAEAPPRAVVRSVAASWHEPAGFLSFEIRKSAGVGAKSVSVLPDLATCDDCLAELNDPADRRYRYPFLNCTNCGPRFTIVRALPYDRPNTTMRGFALCADCRRGVRGAARPALPRPADRVSGVRAAPRALEQHRRSARRATTRRCSPPRRRSWTGGSSR